MPSVDAVRAKFKEFKEDYIETRNFLSAQRAPIAANLEKNLTQYETAMSAVHNSLGPVALKRLQRILTMSSINIDLPHIAKTTREKSELSVASLAESIDQHGSDEYLAQKIAAAHDTLLRVSKESSRAFLEWVSCKSTFRPLIQYNIFAEENNKPFANSTNIDDFARSIFWEIFNNPAKMPEIELSRFIRSIPKKERQQKCAEFERVCEIAAETISNRRVAEEAHQALDSEMRNRKTLKVDILDEKELIAKINQSLITPLMKNTGFRGEFASEYAEQAQDVLLPHARYVAVNQILQAIDNHISSLNDGIDKIEKTLKKLERAKGYKNIDIDLSSREIAIADGLAKVEMLARDMDTRNTRAQSFTPSAAQDSSQYYNHMILYMYMAGIPPFGHDAANDQPDALSMGADFAATMPDIAHLDMAVFNPLEEGLANFSIPDLGHQISAVVDSSSFNNAMSAVDNTPTYTDNSSSISFDSGTY